jgi:hypothetical protein
MPLLNRYRNVGFFPVDDDKMVDGFSCLLKVWQQLFKKMNKENNASHFTIRTQKKEIIKHQKQQT